jgi:hypothetical protein
MSTNKFKFIPGNPCYYSDTYSVIVKYALNPSLVGYELGQMKLEYTIINGIVIRKKLYALNTVENGLIIKSSGVNSFKLNYDDFKDLLEGKKVNI